MSPVNESGPRVRSPARFERDAPHRARNATRRWIDGTAPTRPTRCAAAQVFCPKSLRGLRAVGWRRDNLRRRVVLHRSTGPCFASPSLPLCLCLASVFGVCVWHLRVLRWDIAWTPYCNAPFAATHRTATRPVSRSPDSLTFQTEPNQCRLLWLRILTAAAIGGWAAWMFSTAPSLQHEGKTSWSRRTEAAKRIVLPLLSFFQTCQHVAQACQRG